MLRTLFYLPFVVWMLGTSVQVAQIELTLLAELHDAEGAQLADIDGDGALDLVAAQSTEGGDGYGGKLFWFRQTPGQWQQWTRYKIDNGFIKLEGVNVLFLSGKVYVVAFDQLAGRIYLYTPVAEPAGPWAGAILQGTRLSVQDSLVTDLDGDGVDELIYAWEGYGGHTGGVHWLDWTGNGDPLNAGNWKEHVMIHRPGAWWIGEGLRDMGGDGVADQLLYVARQGSRQPAARPGLFYLTRTADITAPWVETTIDDTIVDDPKHYDTGRFFAGSDGRDILLHGSHHLYLYQAAQSWRRSLLDTVEHTIYNVRTLPLPGERDSMVVLVERDGAYWYPPVGTRLWQRGQRLWEIPYSHPADNRLLWHDLDGDGQDDLVLVNSGGNRIEVARFDLDSGQANQ